MIERPTRACPDFLAAFSEFIDGGLEPARRAEVQAHLDCCEGCLRHLAAYRRGIDAYRAIPGVGVDSGDFWLGFQLRLAEKPATVERAPRRRAEWRTPTMVGMATAAVAIAVIWTGTRIDLGLRAPDEGPRPVVVLAGPELAGDAREAARPDEAELASPPGGSSRRATASPSPRRVVAPSAEARTSPSDPMLRGEFERLREQIEAEAWLGDPYLREADAVSFEPEPIDAGEESAVRFEQVSVRPSEPIPVAWTMQRSLTAP